MSVWITQCLCPQRHCIMAAAFDDQQAEPKEGERELREALESAFQKGEINRYCHICESAQLSYETRRTPFVSMQEALPVLRIWEAAQIAIRAKIDTERKS